jgi:hypothetical protein
MFCVANCCFRFAKRTRAGSSGSSMVWGVTLGGERVSTDGALGVMIRLVSAGTNAKQEKILTQMNTKLGPDVPAGFVLVC